MTTTTTAPTPMELASQFIKAHTSIVEQFERATTVGEANAVEPVGTKWEWFCDEIGVESRPVYTWPEEIAPNTFARFDFLINWPEYDPNMEGAPADPMDAPKKNAHPFLWSLYIYGPEFWPYVEIETDWYTTVETLAAAIAAAIEEVAD